MRDRPLLCGCLTGFLILSLCVITGGARFLIDLRPSVLQETIKGKSAIRLSGRVCDIDIEDNYHILYLKNNSIFYQNNSFEESIIIVYDEEKLNIGIGNQLEVTGEITFYEQERNPGNFNQQLYYQKQGIRASVWALKICVLNNDTNEFLDFLHSFRVKWKKMLMDILGEEDGAVLSAMLLADKSGMNEEMKELYQANGIGHVLAISGLHLSIIGVGLYKIFRRVSGSFFIGGVAGISVLVLYVLMIGMTVSVLRALIMFLFRVGADMVGRHYDSLTALGVAAFVTIVWNPLYLSDGGFWLSYAAIIGIILVLPMFKDLSFQSFWASVCINLVTLPVLLYFFYEVPAYATFLNMIVIPLMSIVLICGLAGSLGSVIFIEEGGFGITGLSGVLLKLCKMIFEIYEKSCKLFLGLPGARIISGQPEFWQIVFYYGVLLLVGIMWQYLRKRNWKITFVILILNCVMILSPINDGICHIKGEISIMLLDVGQGDGIFIRGPEGNAYLIDGGSSDVKKAGKYRLEPFLKSQGVEKIDYVFVSHGDGDHINGITEMIERRDVGVSIEMIIFPTRNVWDDELLGLAHLAMRRGVRVAEMKAGEVFTEGDMTLTCLAPVEDTSKYKGSSNARSMVLALNYRKFDVLLTGDVEAEGEKILREELEDKYKDVSWEILKVAHHGSKNSSSEEFLMRVRPSYALISAGRENMYGHPDKETIQRLSYEGSVVLSTQENGAIMILTDGEKMSVQGYVKK